MTPDPTITIFTTDANLIVRSWDEKLALMTGVPALVARGQPLLELIPDLESSGVLAHFQRAIKQGTIQTLESLPYLIRCAPNKPSPYFDCMQQRVTIAPLRENHKITGTVVTVEDVTERLEIERQLTEQIASSDEAVRLRAVRSLATAAVLEAETLLVKALGDSSWRVRRAAVDGLAQRGGSLVATSLLRSLREEHRNPSILNSVLQVLAHSNVDTIPALIDCLNDPEVDLRIYAALALGEQEDRRAIPALLRALEDSDTNVRYHAIDALGHLKARAAVEPLLVIAESRDFFLAFPALDALTRIGDPTVTHRLIPLMEDDLLCVAVADALGQLGDASAASPLAALFNQPAPPTCAIALALAKLSERYENTYREGSYIADLAAAALTAVGVQNLLLAVPQANAEELRALVLIFNRLERPEVDSTLAELLGRESVRSPVVEALVSRGKRVTPLLVAQLQSEDVERRRAAVLALGRIGDAAAVPALTRLLMADSELTIPTAGALAQIGDRRAFDALLGLIGHPEAAVRQAVVAALNSLGHPAMLSHMVDLLQDKDPHVRESAVKIAGYFAFTECVALLLERCRDADEGVRRAAIELIPYLEYGPVLPTLVTALENDTPKVRAAAARALGQIESALAYSYLLNALKDPDPWVRYYAARSIGWQGYPEAVEALANVAAVDSAHQVRLAAVEALGQVGGSRAVAVLAPLAETTSESDMARAALAALGEITHPNALPPLLQALRSADPERRIHAISALGKRGGAGVTDALAFAVSHDAETRVVRAAIEALAHIASPEAISALLELTASPTRNLDSITALANLGELQIEAIARGLTHSNPDVRASVVEVLARMKHPRASELLISALDDKEALVRLAAVTALEHLGNRQQGPKLAVMAHADPDPAVRRAAQRGLNS